MSDSSDTITRLAAVAFPAMVAARVVGAAISPLLFAHAPILLVVVSPFLIHLVAVAPLVDPALYFPVAIVVATLQSLIGFYFGDRLGQTALEWVVDRIPVPERLVERCLDLVRKLSILAIFVIPGPILGTIAGVAGVRAKTFWICVAPAQAIWVAAAYLLGDALFDYIELVRDFVIEHAVALTVLTATIALVRWLYGRYRAS